MSRVVPLLAVLCTGVALGALVVAVVVAGRAEPGLIEEVAPLDLAAAIPEIAQIRESRGSILAGTSLANQDDSAQFSEALANEAGTEGPQAEADTFVMQLTHLANVYAERAQSDIDPGMSGREDKWRQLADSAQLLLNEVSKAEEPEPDTPSGNWRR